MRILTLLALASSALSSIPVVAAGADVRQCRIHVQGRIDMVDAEMHKGQKPDEARKLVARRDKLRAQYKACDGNPNAYKKNP